MTNAGSLIVTGHEGGREAGTSLPFPSNYAFGAAMAGDFASCFAGAKAMQAR